MSEENNVTQTTEDTQDKNNSTKADTKNVPYDRFTEVNTAKNDALDQVGKLQAQLDAINNAQKEKEQAELVEQGKAKEALELVSKERDSFKKQAEQWTSYQDNKRTSLMEKLTEDDDKSIADGLSLDKLEKYVAKVSNVNAPSTSTSRAVTGKNADLLGYDSIEELAAHNPLEAEKYLRNTVKGYIK